MKKRVTLIPRSSCSLPSQPSHDSNSNAESFSLQGARNMIKEEIKMIENAVIDEFKAVKTRTEEIENTVMDELKTAKKKIMMYIGSIEEAPIFQRFNEYIHGGYRIQANHYSEILSSLFSIHNETVNIWSHLIGLILMVVFCVHTLITFDFLHVSDVITFALFFVGSCAMFLLSTLYHLFNCTCNEKIYQNLLMCDYIGIFSMILGSAVSGFQVSFHCFWMERIFYQVAIAFICLGGIVLVLIPKFNTEEYHGIKVLFYLASVSFTALPVSHLAVQFGFSDTTPWWVLLGLYAAGMFLYSSKFPERLFPGKFDFWFSSHQLWHFFVLFAGIWHYYTIATLYQSRISTGCPTN